jgi:hypothetical protein
MLVHVGVLLLAVFALPRGPENGWYACPSASHLLATSSDTCAPCVELRGSHADTPQRGSRQGSVAFSGNWAYRWTHMYEDGTRLVGGGLGIVVHDRSRIELVGFGTAEPSRYSTLEFRLAYGGLQAEHEILRRGRWAVGSAAAFALGTFSVKDTQADTDESTGIWLVEPEIFVGVHVGEHVRVTVGGGHRWVRGVEGDLPNRSDGDASGPTLTLRLVVR